MHLFGEGGKHAKEALDTGADLGLSSVGFGEMAADGKTVIAETYELDRPADWVLNPSQKVYGNSTNEVTEEDIDYLNTPITENVAFENEGLDVDLYLEEGMETKGAELGTTIGLKVQNAEKGIMHIVIKEFKFGPITFHDMKSRIVLKGDLHTTHEVLIDGEVHDTKDVTWTYI